MGQRPPCSAVAFSDNFGDGGGAAGHLGKHSFVFYV